MLAAEIYQLVKVLAALGISSGSKKVQVNGSILRLFPMALRVVCQGEH